VWGSLPLSEGPPERMDERYLWALMALMTQADNEGVHLIIDLTGYVKTQAMDNSGQLEYVLYVT
jgi:hypothetical protein